MFKKKNKTIKGVTKNGIAKVNKTDEGLFVEIVKSIIRHSELD